MRESLDTLRDLFTRSEFRTGAAVGAVALAVLLFAGGRARRWVAVAWPLATVGALVVSVHIVAGRRLGVDIGIGSMAVGGALLAARPGAGRPPHGSGAALREPAGWLAVVAGACLVAWRGQVVRSDWQVVATPIVAVVVGWALAHWRPQDRRWLGPLFAISAFAVWTTVPDTELARVLLGAAVPMSFATLWPTLGVRRATVEAVSATAAAAWSAGAFALGGVFAWIPAIGGEERPGSIIGAWAAIGVILALPLARLLWHHWLVVSVWYLFGVHVLVSLVAARVIGLWTWALPAVLAAAVLHAVTVVTLAQLDHSGIAPVDVEQDR